MKELIKPNEVVEIYDLLQPECDNQEVNCVSLTCLCRDRKNTASIENDDILF